MKLLKIKNVYGYPSLSPEFREWARGKVDICIGIHNIEKTKRKHKHMIVLSGLAYVVNSKIPVIGWSYAKGSGMWMRSQLPDADRLPENEVVVEIPKYNNVPTSKQLFEYFVNNDETDLPKAFLNMQSPLCYNDRVFNN